VGNRLASVDSGLERLEDVLPADDHHRIDATGEQRGDTVALEAVTLVLEAMDLHQVRRQLCARAQATQRLGNLLTGAHEYLGELDGLLHRRLHTVEPQLGGGLLGVVDDIVECGRQGVALTGVEGSLNPPASGQPVDDVVGDAVAFLLAYLQILGKRGMLGVVDEKIAQQQPTPLHVAPGLLDQGHQGGVDANTQDSHPARILRWEAVTVPFTIFSQLDYEFATRGSRAQRMLRTVGDFPDSTDTLYAGELEIGLGEGLVLATGRALILSVRGFELLVAMARRMGAVITRDELYNSVWGGELRAGDRSVDVYVSKLRGKLETALPDRSFIHTHAGFGYRFQPQPAREAAARRSLTARASPSQPEPSSAAPGLSRNVHIGVLGTLETGSRHHGTGVGSRSPRQPSTSNPEETQ
jgi:DNA-binding winged helix-turn-helix (wHTH) protein